eukprot:1875898-Rhodomonas_salina.1
MLLLLVLNLCESDTPSKIGFNGGGDRGNRSSMSTDKARYLQTLFLCHKSHNSHIEAATVF